MRGKGDMRVVLLGILACVGVAFCSSVELSAETTREIILASEVEWEQLNPARGDRSPKAGTLWGDRKGSVATGFLVEFVDGFSSPPHIHNVSYRGVVISGLVHNDDPRAPEMWMPTGSFWTQPAGEVHITAAKGRTNVAYIEIESGPYLVLPTEKAFDRGERPINVHASNIVWLDTSSIAWLDEGAEQAPAGAPAVAFLWGRPQSDQSSGMLLNLPRGFAGKITSYGSTFRAVVVAGQLQYRAPGEIDPKIMEPGSYFSSTRQSAHSISSVAGAESIIYVRTDGKLDVTAR